MTGVNSDDAVGPDRSTTEEGSTYRRLGAAFTQGSDRYDRLRPGYPDAAVDWLTEDLAPAAPTADIGAGTGKLTAALVDRDLAVTAIDPSADMLTQLQLHLPTAAVRSGTGEATGLADSSVVLAVFGQSWHWVDPVAGTRELARIVAARGRVGWLWNFLDERVDWVADLVGIWHSIAGTESDAIHRPPELPSTDRPPAFGPMESTIVAWTVPMTVGDLTDLVTTRSYYLAADEPVRRDVRERSAALLKARFGGAHLVDLPYRTRCYRCTRSA